MRNRSTSLLLPTAESPSKIIFKSGSRSATVVDDAETSVDDDDDDDDDDAFAVEADRIDMMCCQS